jgi:hypothetical protein
LKRVRRVQLNASAQVKHNYKVPVNKAGVAVPDSLAEPTVDRSKEEWIKEDKLYKEWLVQGV